MAQVVEPLPSKHKALSLNSSSPEKWHEKHKECVLLIAPFSEISFAPTTHVQLSTDETTYCLQEKLC
jgi:hypothetical protein